MLPRNSGSILVKFAVVIPSRKLHLVCKRGWREGWASSPVISVVICYDTPLQLAGEVRRGTLIVGVLSAHTPVARLPKRAEVFGVVRPQLIALETVGKDRFLRVAMKPLSEYSAHIGVFIIAIGWSLTSEDAGNVEVRGREDGRW